MTTLERTFNISRACVCIVVLAMASICLGGDGSGVSPRRKKLIATGWDMPDTKRLRENLAEIESSPFDGVVLEVLGQRNNSSRSECKLRWAFLDEKWDRKWFQPAIDDLRACKFKKFTDNFIIFNANPGSVDWFDDAGWANIVDHWRIAAWVAKQSGVKGILFDPEPYLREYKQFSYSMQPQRNKHTYAEYRRQARRRGREVMKAITSEYKDITVFCYFLNSIQQWALSQARPSGVLEKSGYGLFPAFVDGWLDAAPAGVTLVDGCESAYRYNSDREYLRQAVFIKGEAQRLVSPTNLAKYRAQVQVSYGMYLDAYTNPKGSPWRIDGLGGPRVKRLQANLSTAMRCADEYVWVYGEKFRWWATPDKRVNAKSWPEALPGCEGVLRYVRNPTAYGRSRLAKINKQDNIALNGDFSSKTAFNTPSGWSVWQDKKSKGAFALDGDVGRNAAGSARNSGTREGCFLQKHRAKRGDRYVVRAFCRIRGKGDIQMRIRWQTADDKWTATQHDKILQPAGADDKWSELLAVAEVPDGAEQLIIILLTKNQQTDKDTVWFDDVELYKLD
ncbi:MAG: hypothetical protein QGG42_21370 [Phycisphaerae bacterium]|jgi:hypothetical protein|nr:hypothetical protein [Phycisphaerae bacterium]